MLRAGALNLQLQDFQDFQDYVHFILRLGAAAVKGWREAVFRYQSVSAKIGLR